MEMSANRNEAVELAQSVLRTLLDLMEIQGEIVALPVDEDEAEDSSIGLEVRGEDLGILIGRRGQTLSSLQYLVRTMVGHKTQVWLPLTIDVEGYKQRRHDALRALAVRLAEQVRTTRRPFAMEPMSAFERRIVHLALADSTDVVTESRGEGDERKLYILPKGV